ncbi:OmpA family protein [Candidatus Magnetomonas plexicatena]|uniref:OmpA family protein n=1 Tax=Candidatus Magnetomonas plexicatena TaxID=2552947 RepID=UPI0011015D21|nr:OmpA family protein [Nitrospirales bacterium LBB_01]
MKYLVLLLSLLVFAAGCASDSKVKDDSQRLKNVKTQNTDDGISINKEGISDKSLTDEQLRNVMNTIFTDVHFPYNKYDILDEDKASLRLKTDWLLKHPSVTLIIEGHCDDRGSSEYNLALGDQRAMSVKNYMVSLGVPADRIDTMSLGKEKPICTEENESCWGMNRRAHFILNR